MGLYPIGCPTCGQVHQWFSGNTDQRCPECKAKDPVIEQPKEDVKQTITVTTTTHTDQDVDQFLQDNEELMDDLGGDDGPDEDPIDELPDDTPGKSRLEARLANAEQYKEDILARKAHQSLMKRKKSLQKAANKFRRKRKKIAGEHTPMKDLKAFDTAVNSVVPALGDKPTVGAPIKIIPDIEKLLFPYYIAGASVRSIHQQFGEKFGFGISAIYSARDFYKWDQRRNAIRQTCMNSASLQMSERVQDYLAFFDDLLSESMIRFQENSKTDQNKNPFNTLKVTNIKDIKDLTELMINLANGGVKKVQVENKNGVQISNEKADRLLAILAEEDEVKKKE